MTLKAFLHKNFTSEICKIKRRENTGVGGEKNVIYNIVFEVRKLVDVCMPMDISQIRALYYFNKSQILINFLM